MTSIVRQFDSVLIANRGEIALRVLRTARSLGLQVIAVYSEADRDAPHVREADRAICLGPAAAAESYLDIDKVMAAIHQSGAEAVHPGYGFLSENPAFADACQVADVVFIGPSAEAVALMGNKAAAKRHMLAAGVPCVPGFEGENADDPTLIEAAEDIGFPIMVKAAAGGGGRGMLRVECADELPAALHSARSVARGSFGSDELILERAIDDPRHVEIQVFADHQGNVIHLGERDCSVQRRHQKVLEEAPCPVMTPALRERMGAAAVVAAQAIAYQGAGTVEFLLDSDEAFYFLEMNTRLQVEHPVTEMITGLDLVALQLRVAAGLPLGIAQKEVRLDGWSMEARLYAEEPTKGFLPRTGTVSLWSPPAQARVDSGIETGSEVSPYYDPMLAKIIVHADGRDNARRKLIAALEDSVLFGVQTNRDFLLELLRQKEFVNGTAGTDFLSRNYGGETWQKNKPPVDTALVGALLICADARRQALDQSLQFPSELLNWSSGAALFSHVCFDGLQITVRSRRGNCYELTAGDAQLQLELLGFSENSAALRLEDQVFDVVFQVPAPGEIQLSLGGVSAVYRDDYVQLRTAEEEQGNGRICAPLHGVVEEVLVGVGESVYRGQRVAVVETMKMHHDILADTAGVVSEVAAATGSQVAAGDLLLDISASMEV